MSGRDKVVRGWSNDFSRGNMVYQINILAKVLIDSFDGRFTAEIGLDIRTVRVLRLIGDRPGITFAEIVSAAALERSLTSRIIQHLVREKYVSRNSADKDARRYKLHITETGAKVRARADSLSETGLRAVFMPLEASEISDLSKTLEKLAQWLDSDDYEHKLVQQLAEHRNVGYDP